MEKDMSCRSDVLISIPKRVESGQSVTPWHIQEQLEMSEQTTFRYM